MPVNALPDDPITVLRLLSELEGVSNFVSVFEDEDEIAYIDAMKKKYYKKYFRNCNLCGILQHVAPGVENSRV